MLIVGAKGFAKEVLEVVFQKDELADVAFFDDVSEDIPELIYGKYPVFRSIPEVEAYFKNFNKYFTLGLGGPLLRYKLFQHMTAIGGSAMSTISPFAHIGHFGVDIGPGCNIMTGTIITNDVWLGRGCLLNLNCTIGHDSFIGEFVEMSPGVAVSGNCKLGNFCNIGTNATILPKVAVGQNVIIGAGAVVTQNLPDNCVAVGVPAKIIKQLPPLEI